MIKNLIIMFLLIVGLMGGFISANKEYKRAYKGLMIACYEMGYDYRENNTPKEEGIKQIEEAVNKNF